MARRRYECLKLFNYKNSHWSLLIIEQLVDIHEHNI